MADLLSYEISIAALSCRIGALKSTLTYKELEVYEKTMEELKERFIKNHPEAKEEHLKQIEEMFK